MVILWEVDRKPQVGHLEHWLGLLHSPIGLPLRRELGSLSRFSHSLRRLEFPNLLILEPVIP